MSKSFLYFTGASQHTVNLLSTVWLVPRLEYVACKTFGHLLVAKKIKIKNIPPGIRSRRRRQMTRNLSGAEMPEIERSARLGRNFLYQTTATTRRREEEGFERRESRMNSSGTLKRWLLQRKTNKNILLQLQGQVNPRPITCAIY